MTKIVSLLMSFLFIALIAYSWYTRGYSKGFTEGYQKAQQELAEAPIGNCFAKGGCEGDANEF